jgi:nucleotide-binding universal stress UspA family protein
MYKHILIPTDGSELSAKAEAAGLTLARALDAKVTALTVTPPFQLIGAEPMMVVATEPEYEKAQAERAQKTLERVKSTAAAIGGVPVETVRTTNPSAYEAIIATAKERGCDLVFMASHGRRGISGLILGSETVKVLTHSKVPVLVYR